MNRFLRFQRRLRDEEKGDGKTSADGVHVMYFRLTEPCLTHAIECNDSRLLDGCGEPAERVQIKIGTGVGRCAFMVHAHLLRHYSGSFETSLRKSALREADCEFDFPDADPQAFQRFLRWLYSCRLCKRTHDHPPGAAQRQQQHTFPTDAGEHSASWCSGVELERDYILGEFLLAKQYCSFVLAIFIAHADDSFGLDRVRWILDNTTQHSPIQMFARHWVCWLKLRWLDGRPPLNWDAYPDLKCLDAGWDATDPRKYDLSHWEVACAVGSLGGDGTGSGSGSPPCSHHPAGSGRNTNSNNNDGNRESAVQCVSDGMPSKIVQGSTAIPRRKLWSKYKDPLTASLGIIILVYHFLFPFAWVGIAAYIIVADKEPLLFEASKFYSLIVACCAVIGIWPIGMRLMNMYLAMASALLVVIASVLSFASSSTCLRGADDAVEVGICKMEIGVGVLQIFYAVLVGTSYMW